MSSCSCSGSGGGSASCTLPSLQHRPFGSRPNRAAPQCLRMTCIGSRTCAAALPSLMSSSAIRPVRCAILKQCSRESELKEENVSVSASEKLQCSNRIYLSNCYSDCVCTEKDPVKQGLPNAHNKKRDFFFGRVIFLESLDVCILHMENGRRLVPLSKTRPI